MVPVPSKQPLMVTIQQGSCLVWGPKDFNDHCSSNGYYHDTPLSQHNHRYGIYITYLHWSKLELCNKIHTLNSAKNCMQIHIIQRPYFIFFTLFMFTIVRSCNRTASLCVFFQLERGGMYLMQQGLAYIFQHRSARSVFGIH